MSDNASLSHDLVQQKLKLILADIDRIDAMLKDAVRLFPEYAKAINQFIAKGVEA